MHIIITALVSIAVGIVIGSIPYIQLFLHWTLWYVIPITGVIVGSGLGVLQFKVCHLLGTKVTKRTAMMFGGAAVLAYLATYLGSYWTQPVGEHTIASLMSFSDYMAHQLDSATVSNRSGQAAFEIGAAGTKISFLLDLIGAAVGAYVASKALIATHPVCENCDTFWKRIRIFEVQPSGDEKTLRELMVPIAEHCKKQDYNGLRTVLFQFSSDHRDKKSGLYIYADELICPKCRTKLIKGAATRHNGKRWEEIPKLAFAATRDG